MEDDLVGFQSWLAQKGRKVGTIRNASYLIKRVRRLCGLSKDGVASYLFGLQKNGKRNSYYNNHITALHLYGKYAKLPYLRKFQQIGRQSFLKATMSDEEIESFLSIPFTHAKTTRQGTVAPYYLRWVRMKMFWSIAAFTGMRTGEVAHLKVNDVDWGEGVFVLEDTKTNTPRLVPIPPNVEKDLREYMVDKKEYLFPSMRGGNHNGTGQVIDNVDWHYDFHIRIRKLGIKRKNLSPYSLRHSAITNFWRQKVELPTIMKIAGHKRVETTISYSHMVTDDMKDAVKSLPLVRKSIEAPETVYAVQESLKRFKLDRDNRFDSAIITRAMGDFVASLYQAIKPTPVPHANILSPHTNLLLIIGISCGYITSFVLS